MNEKSQQGELRRCGILSLINISIIIIIIVYLVNLRLPLSQFALPLSLHSICLFNRSRTQLIG